MQYILFSVVRPLNRRLFLVLFLFLFCTGCSLFGDNAGKSALPKQSRGVLPTTPSAIHLGTQSCPEAVKGPAVWKHTVTLSMDTSVEHILCGNLLGISALQAVVMVRHAGRDSMLDIFVYSDITATHPIAIFALKGLLHGDTKISGYNTLLTTQEDSNSLYNKGETNQWTADLCREYKWSDSAGTFVQVMFSGIFPDLTRYQAEFEQMQVNNAQGFQQWRLSAVTTTQHFCEKLLQWPSDIPVIIVSGGGVHDIHAVVQVKQSSSSLITIKLDRLERNADGGLWEVVDVQTDQFAFTVPQNQEPLTSPVMITGHGGRGTIGTIRVLDHLYSESGQSEAWKTSDTGTVNFSKSVPYTLSFQGGTQEGIVALSASNASSHLLTGLVLAKVLLSA
ncbi:MAG: hypothetical protein NVS4B12_02810 [Ktedonobacteraceae bacterium]